jgi:hypothetical protein
VYVDVNAKGRRDLRLIKDRAGSIRREGEVEGTRKNKRGCS